MYELVFSDTAKKQFLKLEKTIQERIGSVLERTRIRPESYFQRLIGDRAYKLRVGDYRVIADIESNKMIILVLKIGHRRNIYNK